MRTRGFEPPRALGPLPPQGSVSTVPPCALIVTKLILSNNESICQYIIDFSEVKIKISGQKFANKKLICVKMTMRSIKRGVCYDE